MTEREWRAITAEMVLRWPHAAEQLDDDTLGVWFSDLADQEATQVRAAMVALYRDGREFPPNGGQILAKLSELRRDTPDHAGAWRLAMDAIRRFGFHRKDEAIAWLTEREPSVAAAVQTFGWRELCHFDLVNEGTVRAQFRDCYRSVVTRAHREDVYAGIPGAGLRALEGGRGGLHKPGFARSLEAGE